MITYEEIRKNEDIRTYIQSADEALAALGFTEHSFAHVTKVAESVKYILETLGFSAHAVELGMIAAYLHDIGNLVNRAEHSQSGAVMAFRILDKMDMPAADIATIVAAIGNHDEGTGVPVNAIAAALILADKSDVRRSRVPGMRILLPPHPVDGKKPDGGPEQVHKNHIDNSFHFSVRLIIGLAGLILRFSF